MGGERERESVCMCVCVYEYMYSHRISRSNFFYEVDDLLSCSIITNGVLVLLEDPVPNHKGELIP